MNKRKMNKDQKEVPSKVIKIENTENIKEDTQISGPSISSKTEIVDPEKISDPSDSSISSKINSNKEDRYSYNFWGNSDVNNTNKTDTDYVKIENLTIGKFEHQSLAIRITYKSEIKETKFGKVASFLGMDETSEIAIVSFGKCGLQLHKDWKHNGVYVIENFTVQEENVNYPSGSNNTLQIKTNPNFSYHLIDDRNILPPIDFNFKSIEEIKSINRNSRVDLIGILVKDYGLETNANNVSLRDLSVTDEKKGNIIVTLWGTAAEKFKSTENSAIVIRKGVVGEFQEKKKITCTIGTLVWLNPQIPETSPILKWFKESNNKK